MARHLAHPLRERLAADFAQPAQRIGDGVERGEARVDAFAGVLEHHLNAGAVGIAGEDARRLARQLAGAELDLAVAHVDQPGERAHQGRLAASGLADKADGFALVDGKAHIVDGVHLGQIFGAAGKPPLEPRPRPLPAADGEQLGDFGNIEKRGHAALILGPRIDCSGTGFQQATMWVASSAARGNGCAHTSFLRGQRSE